MPADIVAVLVDDAIEITAEWSGPIRARTPDRGVLVDRIAE